MKNKFILGLVWAVIIGFCSVGTVFAEEVQDPDFELINASIEKYKNGNYLGCLSELKIYTDKKTDNAVAWYYLGSSYMHIAMQDEANNAFEKVIELDTTPKLTSYAIQAQLCMADGTTCDYKEFTYDEILQLKLDPVKFMEEYNKPQEAVVDDPEVAEIKKLIQGEYPANIHEDAELFIKEEEMKMEQNKM